MYDLSKLLEGLDEKPVFNTVLITLINKSTDIRQFADSDSAKAFAKHVVKDWLTMPKTAYEIVDDYNIILSIHGTKAILVTRDCGVVEGAVTTLERGLDNWGK